MFDDEYDNPYACPFCGYSACETLKCRTCGYDFGICTSDPYADPDCPKCLEREYEAEAEMYQAEMEELMREAEARPMTAVHLYNILGIEYNKTGYTRDIGHDEFKKEGLTIEEVINLFDEWRDCADFIQIERATDGAVALELRDGEVKGRLAEVWKAYDDFHSGRTATSYYDWAMRQAIGITGWLNEGASQ